MTKEAKLGLISLMTSGCLILLVWLVGYFDILGKKNTYLLNFHYAAGLKLGSPVRVSGIQVGKVTKIEFIENKNIENSKPGLLDYKDGIERTYAPVRVTLQIDKDAAKVINDKTQAHINMAGLIGERLIEVVPGKSTNILKDGDYIEAVNPPRFDQLIAESFDLAGKIIEMVDENKNDVKDIITNLRILTSNLGHFTEKNDMAHIKSLMRELDQRKDLFKSLETLAKNLSDMTTDLKTKDGESTAELIKNLIFRLKGLDKEALKKFLQEEGIKAKLF